MRKTTIVMIIIDLFVAFCFFVFYGPFTYFRNLLINTAMVTKNHQYIAFTFYSEETVRKVRELNQYIPLTDDVNLDKIVIDTKPKAHYDNEYDEAVLTRDKDNDDYKYISVKVGKYDAHLVAIYDPSKIDLITSKSFNTGNGQETVLNMCKRFEGKVCINGGMFQDIDGWGSDIPLGYLIKDSKVIWAEHSNKSNLIGFTKENKLLLTYDTAEGAIKKGMRDALEFGPFLIVNGVSMKYVSGAGGYDRAQRVAVAQRKDGVVLFLVTEGKHTAGPTLSEVIKTLELYGAYNAANLDGGTSAQLVIGNKLINHPINVYGKSIPGGRRVVSGFGLLD